METLLPPLSFQVITILYSPSSKEENLPTRSTLLRHNTLTWFISTTAFLESRLVEKNVTLLRDGRRETERNVTHSTSPPDDSSIIPSIITAPGWPQTVVSCVRVSREFHLMKETNFQHNVNDNCNYSGSFLSASSCVALSFVALSSAACTKRIQNKPTTIFNLFVLLKRRFDSNEICKG
jgi:hypothetical protein